MRLKGLKWILKEVDEFQLCPQEQLSLGAVAEMRTTVYSTNIPCISFPKEKKPTTDVKEWSQNFKKQINTSDTKGRLAWSLAAPPRCHLQE